MNDDELTRRLADTLRKKAAQVREPVGAFDPSAPLAELSERRPTPASGPWRLALTAAAAVALVVGATTVVLAARSDDQSRPAVPDASTKTAVDTQPPNTPNTRPATTMTPTAPTPTTTRPSADEQPLPVDDFNRYIEYLPNPSTDANDPRELALTYTNNIPPPSEPQNALRVEERDLPNDQHEVVVFVRQADDSTAESRTKLVFTAQSDGSWRLASASSSHRCQPRRGHQDFTQEPCI